MCNCLDDSPNGPPSGTLLEKGKYDYSGRLVQPPRSPFMIHTSNVFDPLKKKFLSNISLRVDPELGLIIEVVERQEEPKIAKNDIDLRNKWVMPGLVDAHSHIFLHAYAEKTSTEQKRDESFVERIIRSTNHCRRALLAGVTTYRDLGSEGMMEADANVRDAINRNLIPGPRLFVATKVLASNSSYIVRTENSLGGVNLPSTLDACDGVEEIRAAVRRRIGAGADIIKFYADYRNRIMRFPPVQQHPYVGSVAHPPQNPNPEVVLYTQEEMNALCEEARRMNCPVAAHCGSIEGAIMASNAGALTIEHAYWADEECLSTLKKNGTMLVPTLAVCEQFFGSKLDVILRKTKRAFDLGIQLATGGDTGTYPHGESVRELELMVQAGIPVPDVLVAATLNGWKACGGDLSGYKFGWIGKNVVADLIAVDQNPIEKFEAMRNIDFVMKNGQVYKQDGVPNNEIFFY